MEAFIKPFEPNPIGQDPRYHDDFVWIKSEIEKLSGANFKLVIIKAKFLLINYSKDLRIAVYLVLALTAEKGVEGLIEGLSICELLIQNFKNYLNISVLEWLNQPRIVQLLPKEISKDQYERLNQIKLELVFLRKWLSEYKPIDQMVIEAPEDNTISYQDIEILTRQIIDFVEDDHAVYFARALRWGNISLPDDKIIPPPREENIIQLKKIIEQGDGQKIHELCESLFLDSGGVFWLDLQFYTNHIIATQQTRFLLERFPDLLNLHFSNHMPFANDETREWLLSLMQDKKEDKKIIKKIRAKDLNSHIKQLKNQPVFTRREKFEQDYQIIKACIYHKRYDIALSLFELLDEVILKYNLAEWEPELVLNIWQDYYEVLEIEIKKQENINKIQQRNLLKTRICQLDVLRGVRL